MNEFIKIICLVITVYFISILVPDGAQNTKGTVLIGFALLGSYLPLLGVVNWIVSTLNLGRNKPSISGVAISPSDQKELDYLHEKTGFTAHKVDKDFSFNGHIKTKDNPEAEKVENILFRFASCGYVFTKDKILLGKISTITSKEERVKIRRSHFEVIDGFKE